MLIVFIVAQYNLATSMQASPTYRATNKPPGLGGLNESAKIGLLATSDQQGGSTQNPQHDGRRLRYQSQLVSGWHAKQRGCRNLWRSIRITQTIQPATGNELPRRTQGICLVRD